MPEPLSYPRTPTLSGWMIKSRAVQNPRRELAKQMRIDFTMVVAGQKHIRHGDMTEYPST